MCSFIIVINPSNEIIILSYPLTNNLKPTCCNMPSINLLTHPLLIGNPFFYYDFIIYAKSIRDSNGFLFAFLLKYQNTFKNNKKKNC